MLPPLYDALTCTCVHLGRMHVEMNCATDIGMLDRVELPLQCCTAEIICRQEDNACALTQHCM